MKNLNKIHFLGPDTSSGDEPFLSPPERVLAEHERLAPAGSEVTHMGSSSLGLNLGLTESARTELLDRLDGSFEWVLQRRRLGMPTKDLVSFDQPLIPPEQIPPFED